MAETKTDGAAHPLLACIDGSGYADSVADHAGWAAGRLGAPITLLQVLIPREAASDDRSGRIIAGARRQLLQQLADLDHERAKLLQAQARLDLDEAAERLTTAGVEQVTKLLRHGELIETLHALEPEAAMIVIGKRGAETGVESGSLGSNLERILRGVHRPVLIAARAFTPPSRALLAFDGRSSAMQAVDAVSRSPLFVDLPLTLAHCGKPDAAMTRRLDDAAGQLSAGGLSVETRVEEAEPQTALPAMVGRIGADLVIMGAYGHSRLRTMVIGSTTAQVIRDCKVPILVYR
ncbi:MAG: universal stress protein [Pseudomonadota bacterium]